MADISRLASPMSLCEEDLFDVDKSVEKKKKELTALQKQTACILFNLNFQKNVLFNAGIS